MFVHFYLFRFFGYNNRHESNPKRCSRSVPGTRYTGAEVESVITNRPVYIVTRALRGAFICVYDVAGTYTYLFFCFVFFFYFTSRIVLFRDIFMIMPFTMKSYRPESSRIMFVMRKTMGVQTAAGPGCGHRKRGINAERAKHGFRRKPYFSFMRRRRGGKMALT